MSQEICKVFGIYKTKVEENDMKPIELIIMLFTYRSEEENTMIKKNLHFTMVESQLVWVDDMSQHMWKIDLE